jgi:hypothetical protein
VAHFNNIAYRNNESQKQATALEALVHRLREHRYDAEIQGVPFQDMGVLRQAERKRETLAKEVGNLVEDLAACFRLIQRCIDAAANVAGDRQALVAIGSETDLKIAIEETTSELLQVTGVCADAVMYPDLDAGKAVLRQSQILDSALISHGLAPILSMLAEHDQLRCGTALMKRLAEQADPNDTAQGLRTVCRLIDGEGPSRNGLGIDLAHLLQDAAAAANLIIDDTRSRSLA